MSTQPLYLIGTTEHGHDKALWNAALVRSPHRQQAQDTYLKMTPLSPAETLCSRTVGLSLRLKSGTGMDLIGITLPDEQSGFIMASALRTMNEPVSYYTPEQVNALGACVKRLCEVAMQSIHSSLITLPQGLCFGQGMKRY